MSKSTVQPSNEKKPRSTTASKKAAEPEAPSQALDFSLSRALECVRAVVDKKGENCKVLNLSGVSGFTDYFVIASGMSDRQVQSIADSVEFRMSQLGSKPIALEGYSEGRWVLIDFGDVVVHVFQDALREYYDLERLWQNAPKVQVPAEIYGPAASPV